MQNIYTESKEKTCARSQPSSRGVGRLKCRYVPGVREHISLNMVSNSLHCFWDSCAVDVKIASRGSSPWRHLVPSVLEQTTSHSVKVMCPNQLQKQLALGIHHDRREISIETPASFHWCGRQDPGLGIGYWGGKPGHCLGSLFTLIKTTS